MTWTKLSPFAVGALVAAGLYGATAFVVPAAPETPSRAAREPIPPVYSPPWGYHLSNGETVEIEELVNFSGDRWKPDGHPLTNPPFQRESGIPVGGGPIPLNNDKLVLARIRRHGAPAGAWEEISMRRQGETLGSVVSRSERAAGWPQDLLLPARGVESCTLRWDVGSADWRTDLDVDPREAVRGPKDSRFMGGKPDAPHFTLGVIPDRDGAGFTAALAHELAGDFQSRLVLVDREGVEHVPSQGGEDGSGSIRQVIARFELPLDRVRSLRLQTRPCTTLEIPDVALAPRPGR